MNSNPFKLDVPSAEAVTGIELFGVRARDDGELGVDSAIPMMDWLPSGRIRTEG
jgi:hypothetical protein